MNCLPFIIALIINIGTIIFHIVELSTIRKCKTLCSNIQIKNNTRNHIMGIISNLIFLTIIYVLCNKDLEKWAWGVLLFPFIIGFIFFMILVWKVSKLSCNDLNTQRVSFVE